MAEEIEMMPTTSEDFEHYGDVEDETFLDLPDVPVNESLSLEQLQPEFDRQNFIATVRKNLKLTKAVNPDVYKHLTTDDEGYYYYNHKRLTTKRGGKRLLSVATLLRNPDTREFLQMTGYTDQPIEVARDLETVSPEQTAVIKSKMESFKTTEEWAKREKEEAIRNLQQATDEDRRQTLKELIEKYDQIEIQARRRYNEVVENQFRRINAIMNDETRPLLERLRELFRRDGITIAALITAIGMTISAIFLAVLPTKGSPVPSQPGKRGFTDKIKRGLVKVANWLLNLAKRALAALPGVLGGLISFLLKKAGEIVLFLSEHMLVLLMASVVFIVEFIWRRKRRAA